MHFPLAWNRTGPLPLHGDIGGRRFSGDLADQLAQHRRGDVLEAVGGDGEGARAADDMVEKEKLQVGVAHVDDGQAVDGDALRHHLIPRP
jgi:hypothetical protein